MVLQEFRRFNEENDEGGIYFAVCRGKLSEGIDFSDRDARCVIIIGVPFLELKDPKVIIKKHHLDQKQRF
jgi:Rad3-related DNA helicase